MPAKVLVAYASVSGSTREVAEAVAAVLREGGSEVDLEEARAVRNVAGYDAVVLGAALYMFHVHRAARGFLRRHARELARRPWAVFALGPFNDAEAEWQKARTDLDTELAKHRDLKPVARAVFGGRFDPLKLRPPWTFIPALKKLPPADVRDWAAIRGWAAELLTLLG